MRELLSGIGIAYAHKRDDNPLVGRRMPDIDCDGTRLYELLREGEFVLVTATPVELGRSGHRARRRQASGAARRRPGPARQLRGLGESTGCPVPPNWLRRLTTGVARGTSAIRHREPDRQRVAEHADARAEDRPDRPEVPGARGEPDDQPHGEHDDDHRQVGREMDLHSAPRRLSASLPGARDRCAESGRAAGRRRARAARRWCERRTWPAVGSRTRPSRR